MIYLWNMKNFNPEKYIKQKKKTMKKHIICVLILSLAILGLTCNADADVTPVPGGYEVSYQIDLRGTSNGLDILDTFICEWNENGDFSVDYPYTINNRGRTLINHTIGFKPTAALLMGYGLGIPGIGDEKDHMFTVISSGFANSVIGKKWSQAFPGVPPDPRIGHNAMINLLKNAAAGNASALNQLTEFVKKEGYKAGFDPIGSFRVFEWTIGLPIDTTIPMATQPGEIDVTIPNGCSFTGPPPSPNPRSLREVEVPEQDAFADYPFGLVEFVLSCTDISYPIMVDLDFWLLVDIPNGPPVDTVRASVITRVPADLTGLRYRKYGPTPDNPTPHWYDFMFDGSTGAVITGNRATLWFVDGMRGDDDLDPSNNIIVDQGGPGAGGTPTMSEWGMIIFMVLAGIGSIYYLRRRRIGS
jgi:hypothetical protein